MAYITPKISTKNSPFVSTPLNVKMGNNNAVTHFLFVKNSWFYLALRERFFATNHQLRYCSSLMVVSNETS